MIKNRTPEYARERMISRMTRLDGGDVIDDVSEFDAEWKEDLHPRAKDGKFTSGSGTNGGGNNEMMPMDSSRDWESGRGEGELKKENGGGVARTKMSDFAEANHDWLMNNGDSHPYLLEKNTRFYNEEAAQKDRENSLKRTPWSKLRDKLHREPASVTREECQTAMQEMNKALRDKSEEVFGKKLGPKIDNYLRGEELKEPNFRSMLENDSDEELKGMTSWMEGYLSTWKEGVARPAHAIIARDFHERFGKETGKNFASVCNLWQSMTYEALKGTMVTINAATEAVQLATDVMADIYKKSRSCTEEELNEYMDELKPCIKEAFSKIKEMNSTKDTGYRLGIFRYK